MHQHYHFIGIGGIGMGTLAKLLLSHGVRVSGSDVRENDMCGDLRVRGADVHIGHSREHIGRDVDYVIFSSAVKKDNPELLEAHARNIPIVKRGQLLAELMEGHLTITVAGSHGKTTTTSMVSHMLIRAGLDPTTAIGGVMSGTSYHANVGAGKYFVAEVDESDGSFLFFYPRFS